MPVATESGNPRWPNVSAQPVEVRFSTTKSLWFDMVFVVGCQGRVVETSDTMWDIGELFQWLREIANGKELASLAIDREGEIDLLKARHLDDRRCHLTISEYDYDGDQQHYSVYVDAVVLRRKLVWEVYFELQEFRTRLAKGRWGDCMEDNPDWGRLPEVEAWLGWEKHTGRFSMIDDVSEFERYR